MLNATQQVGASVGTALLATLAVGATTSYIADKAAAGQDPTTNPLIGLQAQVEGYTTAFTWASVLLVLGALCSAVMIKATKEDLPAEGAIAHAG
jgi:flagellar motor component MotA